MIGTIVNIGTIILGSTLGIVIHAKLPDRITKIVFQGIGLFTIALGLQMAIKTNNFTIMIFSIVIGAIIGELIDIDSWISRFSEYVKSKIKIKDNRFSEGLITAFLLFCMGSMTIVGAIEEGLGGSPNLLMAKSVLDGFSSIILSSAYGIGVIFSVIPLLIYQGGLTLLAGLIHNIFSEVVVNEMSAIGGLLLIGLGIDILGIKKMKIINMIPSLVIVVILAWISL
jgi:hypothetical protein